MTTKYFVIFFTFIIISSCSWIKNEPKEKPIARVGNAVLYLTDIKEMIKPGLSKEDSIQVLKSLIEKWLRKQLILQKAELNLTDEEKNVKEALEEYRTSLLIYKYEQKYLSEKLDTIVDETEIEKYYQENSSSFVLDQPVVKALFIKLPRNVQGLDYITNLMGQYQSNNNEIESYCYQYATKYDYFNDQWVNLNQVFYQMPIGTTISNQALNNYTLFNFKDSTYHYILKINDVKFSGSNAPLESVEENIKEIIILKRKQKLINDLENNIYFDAVNKNTIYKQK